MSLLVEIRKEPRAVNGELVQVGESVRLPNALALALEAKGFCAWPQAAERVKEHKATTDKKTAAKAKRDKAKAKAKDK